MPVYNGERYLKEALDSVFAQTFQDFEIICVDDGSKDNSAEILRYYGSQVRVLRQENHGQGAARNAGVHLATGVYLAFLDQDDRWYPSKLEQQVAALERNPDTVLVYCNSDRMDREGNLLQVGATLAERTASRSSLLGRLIGEELILPSALLVRREAFMRAGMFDPELRGFEDFDLCARIRRLGPFIFLEEPGMCYRVHDFGFNVAGRDAVIQSRERFLLKMRELYAANPEKQRLIRVMLAECYSDWGLREVKKGNRAEGRRLLLCSLRSNPLKLRTYSRLVRSWLPARPDGK
jgi:glycosyltransferase involved in cell wall biosynthesis